MPTERTLVLKLCTFSIALPAINRHVLCSVRFCYFCIDIFTIHCKFKILDLYDVNIFTLIKNWNKRLTFTSQNQVFEFLECVLRDVFVTLQMHILSTSKCV